MLLARQERVLAIDGVYIHVRTITISSFLMFTAKSL